MDGLTRRSQPVPNTCTVTQGALIRLRSFCVLQLVHDASPRSRHRIREHISAQNFRGSHHSLPETIIPIFSLHDGWYL
jgi:hypothetical protein